MVCIFAIAKIRFKGSEGNSLFVEEENNFLAWHNSSHKANLNIQFYYHTIYGSEGIRKLTHLEMIDISQFQSWNWQNLKVKKTTKQETLRRITWICHQLLYLFTPHYLLCNAQSSNAGTGDTNCRLLFNPCRLQSIESHVIWKLNLWGFHACEWECKSQFYWQSCNPVAQLYHFSWNNINIDIWQWMHY